MTALSTTSALSQDATLRLRVESNGLPVSRADISAGHAGADAIRGGASSSGAGTGGANTINAVTDLQGRATLRIPAGLAHTITVRSIGYSPTTLSLTLAANADTTVFVALARLATELENIVVLSTRSERRIEDEPVRVEVLQREEIEEKLLMTPGDISMMLNETSGLRVQLTSPTLGASGVRIQGLRARYTQILSDGLPLHGGAGVSLGTLQIPPMDLARVEVIKGVASALYGPSALGGVVNLISRRYARERELLVNQTSLGGTDAVLWASDSLGEHAGLTLLASAHRQSARDVDGDRWADLAQFDRGVLRPRVFWSNDAGRSVFATIGVTAENRTGGTMRGATAPYGSSYTEGLETRRADAGVVVRAPVWQSRLLSARASVSQLRHRHEFGTTTERDRHTTSFGELALSGAARGHAWVLGAALTDERYAARDVAGFDYTRTTSSAFVQDEYAPLAWMTIALTGRVDAEHGGDATFTPSASVLVRPPGEWTVRLSAGTGFFAPTPFTDETDAVGLTPLRPLGALRRERARTLAFDVGRPFGNIELNATAFASEVRDPVYARMVGDGTIELMNAPLSTRTRGADLLARLDLQPFHVTATYTFTDASEFDPVALALRDAPLTPRHAAGLVGAWEHEELGRMGIEVYYTGAQRLAENPYRTTSRRTVIIGALLERRFARVRVFLNAENLLDARQTRHDSLLLPARSPEGRWTTDAWAPLEGRSFNGGVRVVF